MEGNNISSDEIAIEVDRLVKFFGYKKVLKEISFRVRFGEIYGLLGPNGAGKTTTVRTVIGILERDGGVVRVMGMDPEERPEAVRSIVGYVPEEIRLYNALTMGEFLQFVFNVRELEDSEWKWVMKLVSSFEINEYWDYPIASLSQGTKQKVAIVSAFMHKPKILVLDEPIKGLDARSARILKELIKLHRERGGAVLFSTHILDIAESICDRIGIIHEGRILAEGSVSELKEMAGEEKLEDVFLILTREREEVEGLLTELRRGLGLEETI